MKSNIADKVILTDCDGVLLDWLFGFKEFMAERGYTEQDDTGYAIWKRYGFIIKKQVKVWFVSLTTLLLWHISPRI